MAKQKPPVIVAELGRPETAAETAARKAENSRLYRERKTVNNLVFSLLVSVAVMIGLFLIVPRGTDQWRDHTVDVPKVAAETESSAGQPLIAPTVPEGWKAKQAQLRVDQNGGILNWFISYTTDTAGGEAYAAITQAFTIAGDPVNETWVAGQLENQAATGTETIGGLAWTVYDHPRRDADKSNMKFGLQTEVGDTTLLVYGTDKPDVLRKLAAEVAAQASTLGVGEREHS